MKYRLALLSLVSLLALALAACGTPAAKTVTVTLTDFKIAAAQTAFTTGVPYHFVVTNKGKTAHELLILPPMSGDTGNMEHMHMASLAVVENIAPQVTKTVDVTFQQAAPAGHLEFACHVGTHYQLGMKLPITVAKN